MFFSSARDYEAERLQREAQITGLESQVAELSTQIHAAEKRKKHFMSSAEELKGESHKIGSDLMDLRN